MENDELNNFIEIAKIKSALYTKIYYGACKKEEIEEANLNEIDKIVLLVLYNDKADNKERCLKIIKEARRNIKNSKNLNKLYENIVSKRGKVIRFDVYKEILDCDIDYETLHNLKKEVNNSTTETIINSTPVEKVIIEKSNKKKEVKKSERTYYVLEENTKHKERKIKEKIKIKQELRIKDVFDKEILEFKKYLYVLVNSSTDSTNYIKAWDIFDSMIERPISDQKCLDKVIKIITMAYEKNIIKENIAESSFIKIKNLTNN